MTTAYWFYNGEHATHLGPEKSYRAREVYAIELGERVLACLYVFGHKSYRREATR